MNKARRKRPDSRAAAKSALQDLENYLAGASKPAHRHLKEMRAAIRSVVPKEAKEVMSYGIPAFKSEKIIVWYAAFAKHCSLFPTASVIADFKAELKPYSISKGTIQFPLDKPLPISLIKRIVKARVAQLETKPR